MECNICNEEYNILKKLPCKHELCESCLNKLSKISNKCPYCRVIFHNDDKQILPIIALNYENTFFDVTYSPLIINNVNYMQRISTMTLQELCNENPISNFQRNQLNSRINKLQHDTICEQKEIWRIKTLYELRYMYYEEEYIQCALNNHIEIIMENEEKQRILLYHKRNKRWK